MHVIAHQSIEELTRKLRRKFYAQIKDRLRAVVAGMQRQSSVEIAKRLEVGDRCIRSWIKRWNAQGESGLWDRPRSGQPKKLTHEQTQTLVSWLEQGPPQEEGRARYRIKDLQQTIQDTMAVSFSFSGLRDLVARLGYRLLRARPRHEKNDPVKIAAWKEQTPLGSRLSKSSILTKKSRSFSKMKPAMDKKEVPNGFGPSVARDRYVSNR